MWLTRLALRNPVLILMLSLMLIVLGVVSLNRLSVDLFPDITIPVIRIATFYTGAGPQDIEKSIVFLEGAYTLSNDYSIELKYNAFNYDDYILLNRYYTANVLRINVGYNLHLN